MGDFKYVNTPYLSTEELYDVAADPLERANLKDDQEPEINRRLAELRVLLQRWTESARPFPQPEEPQPKEISDETLRRLKSLGYVD
jgi:hypothetical protein